MAHRNSPPSLWARGRYYINARNSKMTCWQLYFVGVVYTLYSLFKIILKSSTCGIIAVTLISPEIVCPITVVGVKQVDVFIIVTSQELWTYRKCQTAICLISFNAIKAEVSHDFHNFWLCTHHLYMPSQKLINWCHWHFIWPYWFSTKDTHFRRRKILEF